MGIITARMIAHGLEPVTKRWRRLPQRWTDRSQPIRSEWKPFWFLRHRIHAPRLGVVGRRAADAQKSNRNLTRFTVATIRLGWTNFLTW